MLTDRQTVELVHLHFVRLLCSGPEKDRFAIKGGCNLRFFFDSVRYSEDLDLDVARLPVHSLKEKVTKILNGPALTLSLKSRGIAAVETSAPEQTETTQRWTVGLSREGRSLALHTKIEFSRRAASEEAKVEAVGASVLAEYGFMPLLAPHYPLAPALRQKVLALVGRAAVQARDVFDLSVLSAKAGGDAAALRPVGARIEQAIEALVDFLYLSPTRGRLFAALPELERPRSFRRRAAQEWVKRIPSPRLRTIVRRRLEQVLPRTS